MQANDDSDSNEPTFMAMATADPEWGKSIESARATLGLFLDLYEQHKDTLGVYFAFKVPIQDGDTTAHLWYTYRGTHDGLFHGEHFEIPKELIAYKSVQVRKEEVEDWMVNDHGHLYGGYSIRLQRSKRPEEKRAEFDEYVGVREYKDMSPYLPNERTNPAGTPSSLVTAKPRKDESLAAHPSPSPIKPVIIGALSGILITPITLLAAGASAGAGHGDYFLARILYPASMMVANTNEWANAIILLISILQFPIYGVLFGLAWTKRHRKLLYLPPAFHAIALALVFGFPNPNFS